MVIMAWNYITRHYIAKNYNTKWFNSPTFKRLPHEQEGKSAILEEMSPFIRAKAFAIHTGSLTNFDEFGVLVYYEILKHASNYDRIYFISNRYFAKGLKEGIIYDREEDSQYLFEGEVLYEMTGSYLFLKLLKPHQGDQIMI